MFKSLLSVFFVFFFYVLSAQEADKLVVKNGKKYFSHSVVKGETIFRICKNYSVTSEQLIELNPSLSKGLQLGKPILIPYSEKKDFASNSSIKFNVLVESALSNVASLFNLKEDELKVLNPNSPNQLLAGTQLNVPGDSLLFKTALYKSTVKVKPDTIIQYVIEEKDVLYSIAKRFMTSVKEIQTLNLKTNTTISPNSVLLIPIYDRRVLEMKFRTSKDLIAEQEKLKLEEEARKIKEIEDKKLQTIEEKEKQIKAIAEKARLQKEESEKKRLAAEQLKKEQLAKDKIVKDSIAKVTAEKVRIQKEESEKKRLAAEQLKKEQLAKAKIVNDSISKVTAEKVRIQKEESEKKRLAAEQLKKEQLDKDQAIKDSISKVTAEKIRIQKEESEKQRLAAEQLKKEQLAKEQSIKDSIAKVTAEIIRVQKEESEKQRLAAEQLKKEQLAKDQAIKDSIAKVTAEKIRIQQEELEKQRIVSEQLEKERLQKEQLESQITSNEINKSTKELESTTPIQDSTQFKKKFVLTFLLPFNSDKQNDPTSKVATEFYMGVQLALDSLSKLKFKGKVNVLDCGNDTSKLNPLFFKEEVLASNLIIGPLNGINLIQTADFCNRNNIPMINPIMSNTALLKNNKFVYNAVSSEMSLVKGLAKYVYGKHTKDQVVLVKVGGKDEELYHEFRSNFSNQGSDKLYEVTDTSMLSVIKKDKKSIFVVLTRDKELATKISKQLTEHIDRNKLIGSLSVYGTKDWLNFEAVSEEIKKKIDFKYNSSIDFNSNNQNLAVLRKKFKEKFKISLTKYAAQGYDVTFYFVKNLLLKSTNEVPMMNVFDLNRIEQFSGFENGGSYVFGYEEGVFKRIQVLND